MKIKPFSQTLRVLSALLAYPSDAMRAATHELSNALQSEAALTKSRIAELDTLLRQIATLDPYDVEERYVQTFDRGRATSLHVFEHVHGDSRERGQAMVDLQKTYASAGYYIDSANELPDYLPMVLEFASTQTPDLARGFLSETAHIINAIHTALAKRDSPYASVLAAVLDIAGVKPEMVAVPPEEPMDDVWAEPAAFDGCSVAGQAKPGQTQPIHFVKTDRQPGAQA